jgi:hypothetical protein
MNQYFSTALKNPSKMTSPWPPNSRPPPTRRQRLRSEPTNRRRPITKKTQRGISPRNNLRNPQPSFNTREHDCHHHWQEQQHHFLRARIFYFGRQWHQSTDLFQSLLTIVNSPSFFFSFVINLFSRRDDCCKAIVPSAP